MSVQALEVSPGVVAGSTKFSAPQSIPSGSGHDSFPREAARFLRVTHAQLHTDRDGLNVGEIRSMATTDTGEVWLGGENGLQEFDGQQFSALPLSAGLPRIKTYANVNWLQAYQKQVYFAWADALLRWDRDTGQLQQAGAQGWRVPDKEQVATTMHYWCEAAGHIWVLTQRSVSAQTVPVLQRIDRRTGQQMPVELSGSVPQGQGPLTKVSDLVCSDRSVAWIEWRSAPSVRVLQWAAEPTPSTPQTRHIGLDALHLVNPATYRSLMTMLGPDHVVVAHDHGVTRVNVHTGAVSEPSWVRVASQPISQVWTDLEQDASPVAVMVLTQANQWVALDPTTLERREQIDINLLPRVRQVDSPQATFVHHGSVAGVEMLWVGRGNQLTRLRHAGQALVSETVHSEDRERISPNIRTLCVSGGDTQWMVDVRRHLLAIKHRGSGQVEGLAATRQGDVLQSLRSITDKMALRIECDAQGQVWGVRNGQDLVTAAVNEQGDVTLRSTALGVNIHGLGGVFAVTPQAIWLRSDTFMLSVNRASSEPSPQQPLQVQPPVAFPAGVVPRVLRLRQVGQQTWVYLLSNDSRLWMLNTAAAPVTTGGLAPWVEVELPAALKTSSPLFDLRTDRDGRVLLLARNGALYALNEASVGRAAAVPVVRLLPPQLASQRQFYCMLPAADGSVWLSTTNGLARWSGESEGLSFLGPEVGVLWDDFNASACGFSQGTQLVFGATDGWVRVAPEHYRGMPVALPPRLKQYRIGLGEALPVHDTAPRIDMAEADHLLRLTFSVPYRLAATRTRLGFWLEGFDQGWRPEQLSPEVEYAGLPAGLHWLHVRAAHDGGAWGEELVIPIHITPPWYRSAAAKTVGVGGVLAMVWVAWQRHRLRRAERAGYLAKIEASEQRLGLALWASGDAIWDYDLKTKRMFRTRMPWLPAEAALDETPEGLLSYVHPDDVPHKQAVWAAMLQGETSVMHCEYRLRSQDGPWVWVCEQGRVIQRFANGQWQWCISGTMRDVSALRQTQDELRFLAVHDSLTGLPNRRHYLQHIQTLMAAQPQQPFALLFIDFDRFKHVNDSLGHAFGDRVLIFLAQRMQSWVESVYPEALLCRVGGDEFAVVCPGALPALLLERTRQWVDAMTEPFFIDGIELAMTLSVGIACFPEHGTDPESLQKAADVAMHQVKAEGRNGVRAFDPGDLKGIAERLHLETALRMALPRDEFCLLYQPKQALNTGACVSVEALLRWRHPRWGQYHLETVIGILESSDLIHRVGLWVIDTAARQMAALKAVGTTLHTMAVNVSAFQLLRPAFVEEVQQVLHATGLNGSDLEFEITESVLLSEDRTVAQRLKDLKRLGIRLAIDDFGKGYSSLGRLQQMDVDVLKIDRCFIEGIDVDPEHQRFCSSLVHMMRDLKLTVVAEGVERESQRQALKEMACDVVQGYLYARPMEGSALVSWLEEVAV